MCNHIYGKENLVDNPNRPHVFLKELELNLDYYHNQLKSYLAKPTDLVKKQLNNMVKNLENGINYYKDLFTNQTEILNQLVGLKITTLSNE